MNAPTLLVGLGGTGCKIIAAVSELVTEEQLKRIEFVAIDTDINELRDISKKHSFIRPIQISSRLTVGEYLEINKRARDSWFPVNKMLNSKVLSEGAGQVRSISRLAFEAAVRDGNTEPLHQAISNLYKMEYTAQTQALRIIIVSSLAGGTGSGIIVPAGLYIKNYINTHYRHSATITRGFFLLPEVFYGVIPSESGRNNLRTNAYASLRELDAFQMKADETLDSKYADSVKMEFPCPGTDTFDEYSARPYDFCFLYDAQNANGSKFEPNSLGVSIKHAASCIYAQSIGPTNKRSNSSEDNVIRRICAERGRNRYAGAGSSMLIYPREAVKKYIALSWTKKTVTDTWLAYDSAYSKECKKIDSERANGIYKPTPEFEEYFPKLIENLKNSNDPRAKAILEACVLKDDSGLKTVSNKWEEYATALVEKIAADEDDSAQELLAEEKSRAITAIANIDGEDNFILNKESTSAWENFAAAYDALKRYKAITEMHVEQEAEAKANALFWLSGEDADIARDNFRLEHYLVENGNYLPPVVIRYLLYKVKQELKNQENYLLNQINEYKKYMASFEDDNFDDKSTDVKENISSLASRKLSFLDKLSKQLNRDQQSVVDAFNVYIDQVSEYRVNGIQLKVVQEAIRYVTEMAKAYKEFFDNLATRISGLDYDAASIVKKYKDAEGSSTRYVCVSPKCLNAMVSEFAYEGGETIDSQLSQLIYGKCRSFAMKRNKPEVGSYFSDLFYDGVVGYYSDRINDKFGANILNVNVLEAIKREATYELGVDYNSAEAEQYLVDVITSARALSVPFIEKPMGVEKETIFACTYSRSLQPKEDDNSPMANIVRKHLKEFGGCEDESIEDDRILFYQAFYGLRANELSKFAPPLVTRTTKRDGGVYYKAYFDLISRLNPDPDKSLAITPHIDRWWHIVTKMPDLDDRNQAMQEEAIDAAFFWALLARYIRYSNSGSDRMQYKMDTDLLGMDDSAPRELVVSNGTPCDHLYEILDAISIYPEIVAKIGENVSEQIAADRQNTGIDPLGEGFLYQKLKTFTVPEFPLEGNAVRSIFEIPLLIRRSVKGESHLYSEASAIRVLGAELKELRKYIAMLYPESEVPAATGRLISAQFELFLANLQKEDAYKNVCRSDFFVRICSTITRYVKDMGLIPLSRAINDRVEELTK